MAYLFRIYNSYLGANILMYDKMDESEYPYFFVTTVFYNGMMTNKGIYQMPIMNGEIIWIASGNLWRKPICLV